MNLLHGRIEQVVEKENLYAFLLALFSPVYLTPEKAFEYLQTGCRVPHRNSRKTHHLTEEDTAEMLRMRQTMTYREIAEVYGVDVHCVFNRVRKNAASMREGE